MFFMYGRDKEEEVENQSASHPAALPPRAASALAQRSGYKRTPHVAHVTLPEVEDQRRETSS